MDRKRVHAERLDRSRKTGKPAEYEILIEGNLDPGWSEWFPEMRITSEGARSNTAKTILRGSVPDQSALRGILCKLWDLGLTVLRVERLPAGKDEGRKTS